MDVSGNTLSVGGEEGVLPSSGFSARYKSSQTQLGARNDKEELEVDVSDI